MDPGTDLTDVVPDIVAIEVPPEPDYGTVFVQARSREDYLQTHLGLDVLPGEGLGRFVPVIGGDASADGGCHEDEDGYHDEKVTHGPSKSTWLDILNFRDGPSQGDLALDLMTSRLSSASISGPASNNNYHGRWHFSHFIRIRWDII